MTLAIIQTSKKEHVQVLEGGRNDLRTYTFWKKPSQFKWVEQSKRQCMVIVPYKFLSQSHASDRRVRFALSPTLVRTLSNIDYAKREFFKTAFRYSLDALI